MNKKVLGVFVTLLAVAMLTTPLVAAKPSAEKNNDKFLSFVWHCQNGYSTPVEGYPKINPPWAEEGSPDVKVTHTQAVWTLVGANDYIQIGEDPPIYVTDEDYEGYLYVQVRQFSPTYLVLNYRVHDKIMWGDNYIEMMSLERAYLEFLAVPPFFSFYASGTFSGHGEIDGQKVQVMGVREATLVGADFVIENTGTIQFLGNAP